MGHLPTGTLPAEIAELHPEKGHYDEAEEGFGLALFSRDYGIYLKLL